MKDVCLEICCGSAEDALAAWRGGANRVELNSDLFHGGLTPSMGALRLVKKTAPDFPVMCMVRPREGGFCYTETEFLTMLEDAQAFVENGADGIVFGFLHQDGTIDVERTKKMLEVIGEKEAIFHRAIDVTPDAIAALDILIDLKITRVLTSGQKPTVAEGVPCLKEMIAHAAGRIEILPGGGVTPQNVAWCRAETGSDCIHVALHRTAYDTSVLGNTAIYFGSAIYPREDVFSVTHPDDVSNFIAQANG